MHAMLGLGASHLAIYGGNCASHAIAHRVKAIQSLNQALSTPPRSAAEGDARYGAIFALAFQASCMPDGMTEFLSMIKGCHIIATSSMLAYEDSLFGCFTQQGYGESVRRIIGSAPIVLDDAQEAMLDEFLTSLRALVPLCTSPLEIKFLASTEHIVMVARISAAEGNPPPPTPPSRPPLTLPIQPSPNSQPTTPWSSMPRRRNSAPSPTRTTTRRSCC